MERDFIVCVINRSPFFVIERVGTSEVFYRRYNNCFRPAQ
jgi:hypothetical protein